jgi:hypothetical protein
METHRPDATTRPQQPPPDTCECPDDCRIDHENA